MAKRKNTHYIVQTAAAKMPNRCKGTYRRVAVLEVTQGLGYVSMISERAVGCVRVVQTWEKCNVGLTEKSAYRRALRQARALATSLNLRRSIQRVDLPVLTDYLLSYSGDSEQIA